MASRERERETRGRQQTLPPLRIQRALPILTSELLIAALIWFSQCTSSHQQTHMHTTVPLQNLAVNKLISRSFLCKGFDYTSRKTREGEIETETVCVCSRALWGR